jgi:beta-glucosidase
MDVPPIDAAELRARVSALTLGQKVRLLTGADFWSLYPEPAAGLRRLVVSDGPAGVRGEKWDERDPSANVPSPTALAATWDESRIERLGRLLAAESRRKDVDVLLAPTVNLHRTPYGGRHFECFSEDPLLTARIGAGGICGLGSLETGLLNLRNTPKFGHKLGSGFSEALLLGRGVLRSLLWAEIPYRGCSP